MPIEELNGERSVRTSTPSTPTFGAGWRAFSMIATSCTDHDSTDQSDHGFDIIQNHPDHHCVKCREHEYVLAIAIGIIHCGESIDLIVSKIDNSMAAVICFGKPIVLSLGAALYWDLVMLSFLSWVMCRASVYAVSILIRKFIYLIDQLWAKFKGGVIEFGRITTRIAWNLISGPRAVVCFLIASVCLIGRAWSLIPSWKRSMAFIRDSIVVLLFLHLVALSINGPSIYQAFQEPRQVASEIHIKAVTVCQQAVQTVGVPEPNPGFWKNVHARLDFYVSDFGDLVRVVARGPKKPQEDKTER